MSEPVNKAALAYWIGALIALASDDDRFEDAFIDTDLGGSACSLERGIEAVFTDDELVDTSNGEKMEVWSFAHEQLYTLIEGDEALCRSVATFNRRAGEESQWEGNGMRPIQRRLIAVARRVLVGIYKDAQIRNNPQSEE